MSSYPGLSVEDRKQEAIGLVLRGLRKTVSLGYVDRVISSFRPSLGASTILYMEPDPASKTLQIKNFEFASGVKDELFVEFVRNHRPAMLNLTEWNSLVEKAKNRDPENWHREIFSFEERHKIVSVGGWSFAHGRPMVCPDSSTCPAFDRSHLKKLSALGFTNAELDWVRFRSFVVQPVYVSDSPVGVLVALKNIRQGFLHEDEIVINQAVQLLSRILDMNHA